MISGNGQGVSINGPGLSGNLMIGNYIGLDITGKIALGNDRAGIAINNSGSNMIGGNAHGEGNVISGNNGPGVILSGNTAANLILGNIIGLDASGSTAIDAHSQRLGNLGAGIQFDNVMANTIGGTVAGARNVISGNGQSGVVISGSRPSNSVILGNHIGLGAKGQGGLGNRVDGIHIDNVEGIVIGGSVDSAANIISANQGNGIQIIGKSALILGNRIGTDVTGSLAIGNELDGVYINRAKATIGGSTPGSMNLISGNLVNGVRISEANSTGTMVLGNRIGTDVTGMVALGNSLGISLGDSSTNVIANNLVSGNLEDGILITGSGSSGNLVKSNYVGVDATGRLPLGNGVGILIANASNNLIGGPALADANVISGNVSIGVFVELATSIGNRIQGNKIGLDPTGQMIVKQAGMTFSQQSGVYLSSTAGNFVGPGNAISGNQVGVTIAGFLRAEDLPGRVLTGNVIEANAIGTDSTMTHALSNGVGIYINGSARHQITRNVISGNTSTGVTVLGQLSTGNLFRGNLVGTDVTGQKAISNANGIYLEDAPSNIIGGPSASDGNIISGNTIISGNKSKRLYSTGLYIFGAKATANVIKRNQIGFSKGRVHQSYGVLLYNAPLNPVPLKGAGANKITGSTIANVREFTGAVPAGPAAIRAKGRKLVSRQ